MGCGNVFKTEVISTKDLDLTVDVVKPRLKETSESFYFSKIKTNNIIKKRKLTKGLDNIIKKEQVYNGPIISMLKRQVDKYKKNWIGYKVVFNFIYSFISILYANSIWVFIYYLFIEKILLSFLYIIILFDLIVFNDNNLWNWMIRFLILYILIFKIVNLFYYKIQCILN